MQESIMHKKISVVIPVFNEAETIENLLCELERLPEVSRYDFEYVFVDDGSLDGSLEKIHELAQKNSRITYISLTRNFGKEAAVVAGIEQAGGDAVIVIDADMQHPPAVISQFIQKWNEGFLVVKGVRAIRPHDGLLRKIGAYLFYKLMSVTSGKKVNSESTDFRLLDRAVVTEFTQLKEHRGLNRSLIDWLGFRSVEIEFAVADRAVGGARYSYKKLIKTAVGAIISNSQIPLSLAGYLGCVITFFAGFLGLFIIIEQIILNDPLNLNASASAMMAVFILFLNGIVLMCLGLISLYIGSIHEETLGRPLYVVGKRFIRDLNDEQKSVRQEKS